MSWRPRSRSGWVSLCSRLVPRPFGRKPYERAAAAKVGLPRFRRSAVPAVTLRRWLAGMA